jgi:type II secretory pathway pseudopilin PulG
MKKYKFQIENGISLLEILVVVAIFAILGIIVTRAVVLTLSGSKKSGSLVKVRENVSYSLDIIERQLRNADSIVACPNPDPSIINYIDQFGNAASFSCINTGMDNSYIASGSSSLTDSSVKLASCSLICAPGVSGTPDSISIAIVAQDASGTSAQTTQVSASTKINLRTY